MKIFQAKKSDVKTAGVIKRRIDASNNSNTKCLKVCGICACIGSVLCCSWIISWIFGICAYCCYKKVCRPVTSYNLMHC